METSGSRHASEVIFVVTVIVCASVAGGALYLSSRGSSVSSPVPGSYAPEQNQTTISPPVFTPQMAGLPQLPAEVEGSTPVMQLGYDNEGFSGEQVAYCWAGDATTNQTATMAPRTCHSSAPPTNSTGLPTVAVYPNATVSFSVSDDQSPLSGIVSLYGPGSIGLIATNSSAMYGFSLGSLPTGNYLISVNASFSGGSFLLDYFGIKQLESVNYSEGSIKISIGSPDVQSESFSLDVPGQGTKIVGFVGYETWPLTLSSATIVTGVNLTASSVILGDWVKFLPSYLPQVGPNATRVDMLLSGGLRPFVNNDISNVSMIIQATASDGSNGEVALPLEGSGDSIIVHSLTANQEAEGVSWSVQSDNQTNFGFESIIYDPPNATANLALPVTLSIAGLYVNGSIVPQPSWLQFSVPESSMNMSLKAYEPLFFALDETTTTAAQVGTYTLVVDVQIGGGSLTIFMPVSVSYPVCVEQCNVR